MAFRCDRPKPNNPDNAPRQDSGGQPGGTGSLSFVVHQHRSALSGGEETYGGGFVPNSLSVRLEPDGEGGGQVSIRCDRRGDGGAYIRRAVFRLLWKHVRTV